MHHPIFFIDRRKGTDRREDADPCGNMDIDLFHRKRRKSKDRRDNNRSLSDDYYAYMQKALSGNDKKKPDTTKHFE
ncbi:hypothetical protein [Marinagarivorans algicola]|uniref:hypothetical protein n=1 Tax=Marinagarivorans algicola TaxID=1513270 RepID=UPI0006B4F2DC|nr:hypothetical protein [Marinagarivorans algicola]